MKPKTFLIFLLSLFVLAVSADDWWKSLKGTMIRDVDDFKTIIKENSSKHILINFFMERCPYCRQIEPSWNKLSDEAAIIKEADSQILFLVINGPKIKKLGKKY